MITTGKCPKCENVPLTVTLQEAKIKQPGASTTWAGVLYVCPNLQCQTILGVGIDPVALKADTVHEVVQQLRGSR